MTIRPEYLTYEEHSLMGSNFPRPDNPQDLYLVQAKLVLPITRLRSIIRSRNQVGMINMVLMSAVLGYDTLLMNLEDLDKNGRTVHSPRIYTPSQEDLTDRIYQELLHHQTFGRIYQGLLRV